MTYHGPIVPGLALVLLVTAAGPTLAQAPRPAPPPSASVPSTVAPSGPAMPAAGTVSGEYHIGPEDILQVFVWKNDTLSRVVPVRPDGHISLPLLGEVRAQGFTPAQLRDQLTQRYTEYMPAPEVSVIVVEVRSFKVSVMGEVQKPGRFDLKSATTALDAIAMAGGFSPFASRSRVVILRPTASNGMTRIPFNYNRAVANGGESENLWLRPGDIVLVP
jgi:polysaccharide export outer membrane protein